MPLGAAPSAMRAGAGASGFGTFTPSEGLASFEAQRRLQEDGPNALEAPEKRGFFAILFCQVQSFMFMMTLAAGVLSFSLGEHHKGSILLGLVFFVALANTVGEYSSQDAGAELARMSSARARALRDGHEVDVDTEELVVGDVVLVRAGDVLPADMVVLEAVDLRTVEAVLTGEAAEQNKTVEPLPGEVAYPSNMLYSGTSVVAGTGKAEVVATGMRAQIGLIAKRMAVGSSVNPKGRMSPLQLSVSTFGKFAALVVFFVVCVVTAAGVHTRYTSGSSCQETDLQCISLFAVLRGIMVAVALIPHGMPLVTMIMFRVAAATLRGQSALVTRTTAVDYLAATSVICTDKTGTLTQGRMTAQRLVGLTKPAASAAESGTGTARPSQLCFYPLRGLEPQGGLYVEADITAELKASWDANTSFADPRNLLGLLDAGLPRERLVDAALASAHVACAELACSPSTRVWCDKVGLWKSEGSLTEAALKVAAMKGQRHSQGLGTTLEGMLAVPFSSDRKMSATVHRLPEGRRLASLTFPPTATHFAVVVGAPDKLVESLSRALRAEESTLVVSGEPLTRTDRSIIEKANRELAKHALRSLIVALRPLGEEEVGRLRGFSAGERLQAMLQSPDEARGLCFVSLWGIFDPPRSSVPRAIEDCHTAGIRVVMITGDQVETAEAIGELIGIAGRGTRGPAALRAALCSELHRGLPHSIVASASGQRLSNRASQLLQKAEQHVLQEQLQASMQKRVSKVRFSTVGQVLSYDIESGEGPSLKPRPVGRRLSVHDERGCSDSHEPQYKDPEQLCFLTAKVNVWARAQPTDKVAIVESLASQGHITAMTGDGVNDGPALVAASVGVSMGITGTAVAKTSADLVLLDDDFSSIVAAIREGRIIYMNMQKYVLANIVVKSGECVCIVAAITAGLPLPMTPVQQMYNLIMVHITLLMTLAFEPPEDYVMKMPPRRTEGDLLIKRPMLLWRWLPHVVFFPLLVCGLLVYGVRRDVGMIFARQLRGSGVAGDMERGLAACEFAGALVDGKDFISDIAPFHCTCTGQDSDGSLKVTEQWGQDRGVGFAFLATQLDNSSFWLQQSGPWKDGRQALLQNCTDAQGIPRYCWLPPAPVSTEVKGRPLLLAGGSCAERGVHSAQVRVFAAIQLCEIASILTMRRDAFSLPWLFSNGAFAFIVALVVGLLYAATTLGGVLELTPLSLLDWGLAAGCAVTLFIVHEVFKFFYRPSYYSSLGLQQDVATGRWSIGGSRNSAEALRLADGLRAVEEEFRVAGGLEGCSEGSDEDDSTDGSSEHRDTGAKAALAAAGDPAAGGILPTKA